MRPGGNGDSFLLPGKSRGEWSRYSSCSLPLVTQRRGWCDLIASPVECRRGWVTWVNCASGEFESFKGFLMDLDERACLREESEALSSFSQCMGLLPRMSLMHGTINFMCVLTLLQERAVTKPPHSS